MICTTLELRRDGRPLLLLAVAGCLSTAPKAPTPMDKIVGAIPLTIENHMNQPLCQFMISIDKKYADPEFWNVLDEPAPR
jgi:hypothetical protein